MLTRLIDRTMRRWVIVVDYHQPAPWQSIDSYHRSQRRAEDRCRRALRALALNPQVATIHVRRTVAS